MFVSKAAPSSRIGAAVGAADQAVLLQHLQIPANRLGGHIQSDGDLGHLDVPGPAGVLQDQSPTVVARLGLHSTHPPAVVGALTIES